MIGATFTISLDLELIWGVADKRSVADYGANLRGVPDATRRMLDLFARHGVHATWAAVGLVLCHDPDDAWSLAPPPEDRPRYEDPRLDPYAVLSAARPCDLFGMFAPALAAEILATPGQELGTHTFAHVYALEGGMTEHAFGADLDASIRANTRAGARPASVVFPRNQYGPGALRASARRGLRAYRGQPAHPLYTPRPDGDQAPWLRGGRLIDAYLPIARRAGVAAPGAHGMLNAPASAFLRPVARRARQLDEVRRARLELELERVAETGRAFHLWWHPHNFGAAPEDNVAFLEPLLARAAALRDAGRLRFANMGGLADSFTPVR